MSGVLLGLQSRTQCSRTQHGLADTTFLFLLGFVPGGGDVPLIPWLLLVCAARKALWIVHVGSVRLLGAFVGTSWADVESVEEFI